MCSATARAYRSLQKLTPMWMLKECAPTLGSHRMPLPKEPNMKPRCPWCYCHWAKAFWRCLICVGTHDVSVANATCKNKGIDKHISYGLGHLHKNKLNSQLATWDSLGQLRQERKSTIVYGMSVVKTRCGRTVKPTEAKSENVRLLCQVPSTCLTCPPNINRTTLDQNGHAPFLLVGFEMKPKSPAP